MADSDLPIVFEPDHALRTFLAHGRIIYNHPERKTTDGIDICYEAEEDSCEPVDAFYRPDYPFKRNWIPSLSLHVQQDPITVDAVG